MSSIIDRVRREPVLITALVQAVLALLVAFGLDLDGQQTASILAVTAALLAIVARGQVAPMVDVLEHADDGLVVSGPANDVVPEGMVVREIGHDTTPPQERPLTY